MQEFIKFYNDSIKVLNEYRTSKHLFDDMSLRDAYKESYNIFLDLGFTTASTFAMWDFIYRLLPDSIKSPEVVTMKKKSYGTNLRPFVVKLINDNIDNIDIDELKLKMLDRELVNNYLKRQDYGYRRKGLLNKLSKEENREIKQDY